MKPVLVFDIETIPDVAGLRRLNDLPAGLSDDEVAELAFQQRRAKTGNDFLQLHLQRIVTISCDSIARQYERALKNQQAIFTRGDGAA